MRGYGSGELGNVSAVESGAGFSGIAITSGELWCHSVTAGALHALRSMPSSTELMAWFSYSLQACRDLFVG
jgi:hypothetical protein